MKQREIKFKIWDSSRKEWIHQDPISLFGETIICGEILRRTDDTFVKLENLNDLVALQFTGLLDKNGKEIYEGDIICSKASNGNPINHLIKFFIPESKFVGYYHLDESLGFSSLSQKWIKEHKKEIVGNIYSNPESGFVYPAVLKNIRKLLA